MQIKFKPWTLTDEPEEAQAIAAEHELKNAALTFVESVSAKNEGRLYDAAVNYTFASSPTLRATPTHSWDLPPGVWFETEGICGPVVKLRTIYASDNYADTNGNFYIRPLGEDMPVTRILGTMEATNANR